MTLHLHEFGTGEKRGLWLHGWLGSGRDGEKLAHALGQQLICPDLPGHGGTPLAGWTLENTLTAIAELAAESTWAGGYSMGGRLLMMSAAKFPDAFRNLVIESASLGLTEEAAREARKKRDGQRAAELKEQGRNAFCEEWYRMEMWGGLEPPPRSGREEDLAGALELFSVAHQPDLRPWLCQAPQKILWLAGRRDRKYAQQAEWVKAHTSHPVAVLDAGHNVHAQRPEAWAGAVGPALRTGQPSGS